MRKLTSLLFSLALIAALTTPTMLQAQKAPSGGGGIVSAMIPADQLGGGSLLSVGGKAEFGITSKLSIGGSLLYGWDGQTETGELRNYSLWAPAANFRFSLFGDAGQSDLALLLSPGLLVFNSQPSDPEGNTLGPGKTDMVPVLGPGLGGRVQLFESVYAEIEARDWMTWAKDNTLGELEGGDAEFAQSPEVRIGLSVLFGPETAHVKPEHRIPISTSSNYQPVAGNQVRLDPIHQTSGRTHQHQEDGRTLQIHVQDSVDSANRPVPSVRINGPVTRWAADTLGTIHFDAGSAQIKNQYRDLIRKAAQRLRSQPESKLALRSFTDVSGAINNNFSLAERRGTNVKERLVRLFNINNSRIDVVAIGADDQAKKSQQARRVDLVLKTSEGQ